MNKAGRIAARLCLTLHCVRSIETTGQLWGLAEISQETAENAARIAEWFIGEAERVYEMLAGGRVDGELTADQRAVMKVLRNKGKPMTEDELRKASRQVQRINLDQTLRELLKVGAIQDSFREQNKKGGRPAIQYEISPRYTVSVTETPQNTGEKRGSGYGYTPDTPENDFSTPDAIEGFEAYRNPESAPLESSPPVSHCPKCVHHTPEEYPDGLCQQGYCQMDLPCHDYEETAKTETAA